MRRVASRVARVSLSMAVRHSTTAGTESPVNVETFTLNEEVVKRHQEIAAIWNAMSEELGALRSTKDYAAIISATQRGLKYHDEVGAADSPAQCVPMLLLEQSQAHYNTGDFAAAMSAATKAKEALQGDISCDMAKLNEVKEFIGFIELKGGDDVAARKTFEEVLHWIDVESRKAMPMVAVAAKSLRRTTVMGLGLALEAAAQREKAAEGDFRPLFSQGLERLIECLDEHIEEKDMRAVKETLMGALKCFIGLGDTAQAMQTCTKYISWCKRHEDDDGVAAGEKVLKELEELPK